MTPTAFKTKLQQVKDAWNELAPSASFAGMTLAEFTSAVDPSFTIRVAGDNLAAQVSANIAQRNAADTAASALIKRVVFSVKGDPAYGDDSALYRAMGYKTASEYASGLSRTTTPAQP